MYAVVQVGSTQFQIQEGDTISAHRLTEESGKTVTLDKVLLFAKGDDIRIGQPYLKDVKITAKVVAHDLGNKISSMKNRRKKNSSDSWGHRQKLTSLNITKISA